MTARGQRPARPVAVGRHAPAAVVGVLTAAALVEALPRAGRHPVSAATLAVDLLAGSMLALGTTLPPAFLEAAPAAVTVAASAVLSVAGFHCMTGAGVVAAFLALYRLGRLSALAPRIGPALCAPLVVLALIGSSNAEERVLTILLVAGAPAALWAGLADRARAEASVHRAAREAVAFSLLEHTARGERARIARELHDVVAHHISMIAVQAETARLATPGMPEAGAERLLAIGDTARAGLTEMRRLLGVLRADADADADERRPQPGLSQLNDLLDNARIASGAGTRLILSGRPLPLDPGVELAAYRIVQEALTNARRHAPGAAVDVELHFTDEALLLRIRDNGPGPKPTTSPTATPPLTPGHGHGLAGMRERAAAAGGRLAVGRAPGGGFLIDASLPTKVEESG